MTTQTPIQRQTSEQDPIPDQLESLLAAGYKANTPTARGDVLTDLIELYGRNDDDETAQEIRRCFLLILKEAPGLLNQTGFSTFLAEQVEPEDFLGLEWEAMDHMVRFFESLYSLPISDHDMAERVQDHLQSLLRHTLQQFEQRDEKEKMIKLMRLAPSHAVTADAELRRLRHRAYAYEMRRVRRNRRLLYIYLVIQAFFVLAIFPFLFINAENGRLQRQVEQLADVELGDDGYQPLNYSEAAYWSIITASSIGYGDITPTTTTGRIIAAILGTIGVITVGIFAGLVLDWLSPRRIGID
jgi:hypothetical protein